MPTKIALPVLALLLAANTGCPRDKFEIVMERTDGGVRRTITAWHADDNNRSAPSAEVVAQLTELYGPALAGPETEVRFSKVFADRLPADLRYRHVHNFGACKLARSPLGESLTYLERLPGEPHMLDVAHHAQRTANLTTQALYAHFKKQPGLADRPDKLPKLEQYMTKELRDDILEVGLLTWIQLGAWEGEGEEGSKVLMRRLAVYLAERGYTEIDAVGDDELLSDHFLGGMRRKMATCLGYGPSDPIPPALAALTSTNIEDVITNGLNEIGSTKEELGRSAELAMGELMGTEHSGEIVWKSDQPPTQTNGAWDGEKKQVTWNGKSVSGGKLPAIMFAQWASPNTSFQKAHFGAVVLDAELPGFNAWHRDLSAVQQSELATFFESLTPGPDLQNKLEVFRFRAAATGNEQSARPDESPSPRGIRLIIEGLPKPPDA